MNSKVVKFTQRDINAIEESTHIQWYARHLNSHAKTIIKVETVLETFQAKLPSGHNIPDAIFFNKNGIKTWVETTTFSRSEAMRKNIGEMRTGLKKSFNSNTYKMSEVEFGQSLQDKFHRVVAKKTQKTYLQFAGLTQCMEKGTLLLVFVYNDPYFDEDEYQNFLDFVMDKHCLRCLKLEASCFDKLIFGSYVRTKINMQFKFETIWTLSK